MQVEQFQQREEMERMQQENERSMEEQRQN